MAHERATASRGVGLLSYVKVASCSTGGPLLFAALGIAWSPRWLGVVALDVGDSLVGLEAQSDNRPTAGTTGPMLGARVGFGYGG